MEDIIIIPTANKPIKVVWENTDWQVNESEDGENITFSRKLTVEEIAKLFDMTVEEVSFGQIGLYKLDESE